MLVNITARAWSLSILASLAGGTPGRQAPLLSATGATRTSFGQSMTHLIDLGLVERNPGHGHPLRPEYRLTADGAQAATAAKRILDAGKDDAPLLRRVWTVPVLVVCQQPRSFGDIGRTLAPITDRALSQTLHHLHTRRWIRRRTDKTQRPPRPRYQAANAGFDIGQAAIAVDHLTAGLMVPGNKNNSGTDKAMSLVAQVTTLLSHIREVSSSIPAQVEEFFWV
ncbi:MAG: winged helix-turn-helix transcriptional regulator [Pseudomonadota bacterium]